MRTMVYRLKLDTSNSNGYVISNTCNTDMCDLNATGDEVLSPAIKMRILDLPDESEAGESVGVSSRQEYLDQFEFPEDNWLNPEFRACYQKAICGEDTEWKLSKVSIDRDRLSLVYTSEKRFREIQNEGDPGGNSPYYSEVIYFSPNETARGGLFCFEIERPDMVEFYRVTINRDLTCVEEHVGSQVRRINFDREVDDDGQWVTIEWCCG